MTGLLAVSPLSSTNGSSRPADPGLPGQQRRAAGPPGDAVVGAEAVEGAPAEGQGEVECHARCDSPAGELAGEVDDVEPARVGGRRRLVAGRAPRRPRGRRRPPAGCRPGAESGPLGTSRKTSSSTGRSGVKVDRLGAGDGRAGRRRGGSRGRPRGRSGSGSARSAGQASRSADGVAVAGVAAAGARRRVGGERCRRTTCSRRAGAAPAAATRRPRRRTLMPGGRPRGPGRAPSRRRW